MIRPALGHMVTYSAHGHSTTKIGDSEWHMLMLVRIGSTGSVDDVRIYSYTLSEDEIRALYTGQEPDPTEN